MRALRLIVGLALTLVLVLFALSNRGPVAFGLWPFGDALAMPLFLPVLVALAVGFLAGSAVGRLGRRRR